MKCVDIFYTKYLSEEKKVTIGGIQTYITDLCEVISEMGMCVRIIQFASEDFTYCLSDTVSVSGYSIDGKSNTARFERLYDKASLTRTDDTVLTVFATDTMIPKKITGRSIAIQHGIFWDIPKSSDRPTLRRIVSKALFSYRTVSRLERPNTVVCVDYNFPNWYRTQVDRPSAHTVVIPNYTRIAPPFNKPDGMVNIIFARRLFSYRGTRVFTEAITRLLAEEDNIRVTVAGTGEDADWMHERLDRFDNVEFITYESRESMNIHRDKHIAVVPTVGSEGTSLSLLEAMSAQCAVICTDVGGMTNIVIDGFNGIMVEAGNAEALYTAMKTAVRDKELRERLAAVGYETVKTGFDNEKWKKAWKRVLGSELGS